MGSVGMEMGFEKSALTNDVLYRVFLSSSGLDKRVLFFDIAGSKYGAHTYTPRAQVCRCFIYLIMLCFLRRIATHIDATSPLTCIDFSPDGMGIAIGEFSGRQQNAIAIIKRDRCHHDIWRQVVCASMTFAILRHRCIQLTLAHRSPS